MWGVCKRMGQTRRNLYKMYENILYITKHYHKVYIHVEANDFFLQKVSICTELIKLYIFLMIFHSR